MGKDPTPPAPTRLLSAEEQARVVGLLERVADRLLFNLDATDADRRLAAFALWRARQGSLPPEWIGPMARLFERFPDPPGEDPA